jgi:hypothetical protein
MSGTVGVVFGFSPEHEAVEATGLAHGFKIWIAAGEQFVDVGLMADVESELVGGRVEDGVQGKGEFDHAEVGAEMAAGFREHENHPVADFLRELLKLLGVEPLYVRRGLDGFEDGCHGLHLCRSYTELTRTEAVRKRPEAYKSAAGRLVLVERLLGMSISQPLYSF